MLWGEENNNDDIEAEKKAEQVNDITVQSRTEEKAEENSAERKEKGSVVACDFYNSGGLMHLSDVDIVALLMGQRPGSLPFQYTLLMPCLC